METDNELEEGEAWYAQEDDSFVDLDALSYIDAKIQDVLGHFQKDFEDGVSAKKLGSKFGNYGSFLPTYQRSSSVLCQFRSSHKLSNQNDNRSPCNAPVEVTYQNPYFTKNNTVEMSHRDTKCQRNECTDEQKMPEANFQQSFNKTTNGSNNNSLKLRIKVGPNNKLIRNNVDIYSGLGLDISPSSSCEDSPDACGGISPYLLGESPNAIIQVMTCFSIPDGFLISPLPDSLFQLMEKHSCIKKKSKSEFLYGMPQTATLLGDVNGPMERHTKSREQKVRLREVKYPKGELDVNLSMDIDTETSIGGEHHLNSFNKSTLSILENVSKKSERNVVANVTKNDYKMLDCLKETKTTSLMESTCPGLAKNKILDLIVNTAKDGPVSSGNKVKPSREQLNSRESNVAKTTGEQISKNLKNENFDLQREVRSRTEKDSDISKNHSSGLKMKNEQIGGSDDHLKPCSPFRDKTLQVKDHVDDRKKKFKAGKTISESFGDHSKDNISGSSSAMPQEKKKNAKVGRAEKSSKVIKSHKVLNGACIRSSLGNLGQDDKAEQFDNNFGTMDADLSGRQKRIKDKHEKQIISAQTFKEKSGNKKAENTRISGASISEPILAPITSEVPASGATVAPQVPIVIKENWVCCDICQKWRLLPYGTDTGHLPKKWQCNLLNWLPGMNSCDISEEDTTNALHALYVAPVPENHVRLAGHHNVAPSCASLTTGVHLDQNLLPNSQNVPAMGKKKIAPKHASDIASHLTSNQILDSAKKGKLNSVRYSSDDVDQCHPFEPNMSSRRTVGNTSRSTDLNSVKQKLKQNYEHKNNEPYSDGVYHVGNIKKSSELKSKREACPDVLTERKKQQKDNLQHQNKVPSNSDIAAKAAEGADIDPRFKMFPLSNDSKCDISGKASSYRKLRNEDTFIKNGESKEYLSVTDSEKFNNVDPCSRKRKGKEWQEDQPNEATLGTGQHALKNEVLVPGALCRTEPVKDEKIGLLPVVKESKIIKLNNLDKKVYMTRVSLPSNREHLPAEMDITCSQIPVSANSSSSKVSDSHRSRSNILEMKASPVESVSSSPLRIPNVEKLSRKRILQQYGTATNTSSSALGPKRHWDNEVNCGSSKYGKERKEAAFSIQKHSLQRHKLADSTSLDCSGEPVGYQKKETNQEIDEHYGGQAQDRLYVKRNTDYVFLPSDLAEHVYKDSIQNSHKVTQHHLTKGPTETKSGNSSLGFKGKQRGSRSVIEKNKLRFSDNENTDLCHMKNLSYRFEVSSNSEKQSMCPDVLRKEKSYFWEKDGHEFLGKEDSSKGMTSKRDNSSAFAFQERIDGGINSVISSKPKDFDSMHPAVGTRSVKPESRGAASFQPEKASNHNSLDRTDYPELQSGMHRPQLILSSGVLQESRPRSPNITSSQIRVNKLDVDIVDALSADASKVVIQHRQLDCRIGSNHNNMRNGTSCSLSSPIRKENHSVVLKEARDLKHTANHLKEEGLALESTGLYFEAALKFLHVASLMEPPNIDTSKLTEAAQMYFETAKLCEFVAHEYEKAKDMAAAALAYKCVEVSYLKAAYCKNPNASKDQHDLQTALQFLPLGESPSSSASDVDNLNTQSTNGKNSLAKGTGSPQVAGNHVIAAQHHQQVLRLIHYINDLNCAFEATKKSQIAIAAASVSLEKDRVHCLSFIRKVLDFNFHNVEGLLRLVRLALESIGR